MTIDTDELRRKLRSDDFIDHVDIHSNVKSTLAELMDRLEAAEKERDALRVENETLAANLRGKHSTAGATYAHLIAERDALRARIEQMERQEPVAWYYVTNGAWDCYSREIPPEDAYDAGSLKALYLAPGAKGEEK